MSAEQVNSVNYLLKNNFTSLSLVLKLEIIKLGRSTPNLAIKKDCLTKGRKCQRTFHPKIYVKHPWLSGCNIRDALFCCPEWVTNRALYKLPIIIYY